jgi:hypothetical protein
MRTPLRQGDLDGLCGLYALINGVVHITSYNGKRLSQADRLELFKRMATRLFERLNGRQVKRKTSNGKRPPISFLWEGTSIKELPPMLDEIQQFVTERLGVRIVRSQPLLGNHRPESLDQYWARLKGCLEEHQGRAIAIVGYNWRTERGEEGHWTCVRGVSERQMIRVDSLGGKVLRRSRLTMKPPTRMRPYRVAPHDLYLLAIQG